MARRATHSARQVDRARDIEANAAGLGPKGSRRRQEILDTTKGVLLEAGPHALSLRDIADRLGMTHGNLQYYFATKGELLRATYDQELAKYTEGLRVSVDATTTARGRLAAIIDSGIAQLGSPETALWRMAMSMVDFDNEMADLLRKENEAYRMVVVDELALIAPQLSLQRRRHIARIIQALLDGIGLQLAMENADSSEMVALRSEVKAAVEALVDMK